MTIKAGDQNAVFAVKAKEKPLSMADAAKKYKISTPNHMRNYIDFDIDDSRIEFRKMIWALKNIKLRETLN